MLTREDVLERCGLMGKTTQMLVSCVMAASHGMRVTIVAETRGVARILLLQGEEMAEKCGVDPDLFDEALGCSDHLFMGRNLTNRHVGVDHFDGADEVRKMVLKRIASREGPGSRPVELGGTGVVSQV